MSAAGSTWICSDRRVVNSDGDAPRYTYEGDNRDNRRCELNEAPLIGGNQYDAGGPGDAVEIIVHFNHPLITPLGLVDYVPLQARRVMINESFRSTRVVNLPSSLLGATWTPSHTFTPTDTPPPTDTPVPTSTATDTPEPTLPPSEEPTLPPVCTDLTFASTNPVQLVGDALQVNVVNHGTAPFFLSGAEVHCPAGAFGGMYAYEMRLLGRASLWLGNDAGGSGPERIVSLLNPYVWLSGPPDYSERRIDAGATSWQMRFANGPSTLSNYFRTGDFTGTRLMFSTSWGGDSKDCILSLSDLPLPTSTPDTPTPQPVCQDYRVNWGAFGSNGVVRYTITNTGTALGYITRLLDQLEHLRPARPYGTRCGWTASRRARARLGLPTHDRDLGRAGQLQHAAGVAQYFAHAGLEDDRGDHAGRNGRRVAGVQRHDQTVGPGGVLPLGLQRHDVHVEP